jgi:hypothetical protein
MARGWILGVGAAVTVGVVVVGALAYWPPPEAGSAVAQAPRPGARPGPRRPAPAPQPPVEPAPPPVGAPAPAEPDPLVAYDEATARLLEGDLTAEERNGVLHERTRAAIAHWRAVEAAVDEDDEASIERSRSARHEAAEASLDWLEHASANGFSTVLADQWCRTLMGRSEPCEQR